MSDSIAGPRDPRTEPRPRSPLLAAVTNLMLPPLGHVYAGRPWRGVLVVLGMLAWGVATLLLSMAVPVRALRIAFLVLLPAGRLFVVWDAARVTRPVRHGYALRPYNRWYVYALLAVTAWVVFTGARGLLLRYLVHAWKIPSTSMEPALLQGDFILASPRHGAPIRRGQVVVQQDASGEMVIRRVVAEPGDVVEMRHKALWLNGRRVREPYARHIDPFAAPPQEEMLWQRDFLAGPAAGKYAPTRDDWGPLRVPRGHYLTLGDNRDNSYDGRWKGFTPDAAVSARPVWIYLSAGPDRQIRWSRIGATVE